MFRLTKYWGLIFVIVVALFCADKAEDEIRSLEEYEEVSIDLYDMLLQGNCIPKVLNRISINSTISVSNEKSVGLSFLSDNEIVSVTEGGKVFISRIDSGSVSQIADFSESTYSWEVRK